MASIVLGIGTAHTPLLILPPQLWDDFAARDRTNPELVFPPDGYAMSFDDAVASVVPPEVRDRPRTLEVYQEQYRKTQKAMAELKASVEAAKPDVVVIVSDDQDEWFYDNNMPAFSIYWGETAPMIPRPELTTGSEIDRKLYKLVADGYCGSTRDVPVHSKLGRHLIEWLIDHDFDISHLTYTEPSYGGTVVRHAPTADGGELNLVRTTASRPVGLPHGFSFVVEQLLPNVSAPILPVIQNTCYPPNAVTPRRCYQFGGALADGIAAWPEDLRVAVIASGGLSHFVVDEEFDRDLLDALADADADRLMNLPRHRLRSATSECVNWVTLGAMMAKAELKMELLAYEPVYRTEAGTGAGLGHARWL